MPIDPYFYYTYLYVSNMYVCVIGRLATTSHLYMYNVITYIHGRADGRSGCLPAPGGGSAAKSVHERAERIRLSTSGSRLATRGNIRPVQCYIILGNINACVCMYIIIYQYSDVARVCVWCVLYYSVKPRRINRCTL